MKLLPQYIRPILYLAALTISAGCTATGSNEDASTPEATAVTSAAAADTSDQAAATTLAGTAWRLVRISSMDDTVYTPDDPARYTLAFAADGSVALRADCNRGAGTWTSPGASQLQFGPIAATRAMCPPGSLSGKYLAQFEWVRSYVLRDGHLFLATLADGSIIEFEPATES